MGSACLLDSVLRACRPKRQASTLQLAVKRLRVASMILIDTLTLTHLARQTAPIESDKLLSSVV